MFFVNNLDKIMIRNLINKKFIDQIKIFCLKKPANYGEFLDKIICFLLRTVFLNIPRH